MPLLESRLNKVGNVVKDEFWKHVNFCRTSDSVNTTTAGADAMEVGAVLYQNDKAGDWLEYDPVAFVAANDNVGILVDDRIQDDFIYDAVAGDQAWTDGAVIAGLAILNGGPSTVRQGGLRTVALSAPQRVIMDDALAVAGIKVIQFLSIEQSSDLPA